MSGVAGMLHGEPLRRFKPYAAYKDSGVEWLGEIPEGWGAAPLFTVAREREVRNVGGQESNVLSLSHGRIIRRDVSDNFGLMPDSFDTYQIVEPGNIVLRLTDLQNDKRSLRVGLVGERGIITSAYVALSVRRQLQPEYAAALLHAYDVTKVFYSLGGGVRQTMKFEDLKWMPLLVPELPEQRAIAAFLDRETARIDVLVAKKERLIELLQEKRTALITRAVTKGLDPIAAALPTASEAFPTIPVEWKLRKLRRLIAQVKRPVEVDSDSEYQEIGIRSWGKGIFHKEPLRGALLEEKRVFRIEPGDFVLNIVFAWEGAVAVATEAERGMVGSHRFPTFRVSDEVHTDYLLMLLQTAQGRWLMEVNSPGAAGRNKTIRLGQFLDELIPLPPLRMQQRLVQRFRSEELRLDSLVTKLCDAIERLKELRTALISAAVTGKIDVREIPV